MEIVIGDREQMGNLGFPEGRTPTFISRVASYGFKLVHLGQFVVWCLKQSFAELWSLPLAAGRSRRTSPEGFASTDPLLKDSPCHNETTAAIHRLPSYPSEEAITKPPPHIHSAQTDPPDPGFPTPKANALCQPNFEPARPSFQGCVQNPEGRPCGAGSYSDVFRCRIRFVTPSKEHPTEVAVKVLRAVRLPSGPDTKATERLQHRFRQEVETWRRLPKHPNIVPLIGWSLEQSLSLISPWYEKRNLGHHLKDLSDTRQLHVLLGVAKGLDCLHSHSPPVVHGDLKPENILLADDWESLLTDFGLSTIVGEEKTYTSSHGRGGSVPYMSPECIEGKFRSPQSDIYSFGSLAFTVLTGERPYDGLKDTQVAIQVCNGNSPNGPVEDWSRYPQLQGPIKDLLIACWSRSPSARPSMSVVVKRLTTLIESHELDSRRGSVSACADS